tara:strand:- start:259 stop:474 length:216 start_codon:yes stop_codon:yes gene_type:complete
MTKPQLVGKQRFMSLNEIGKDAYYFSVIDLKDIFFINGAKIKEESDALRALFLDSKNCALRKVTMPKSIDS